MDANGHIPSGQKYTNTKAPVSLLYRLLNSFHKGKHQDHFNTLHEASNGGPRLSSDNQYLRLSQPLPESLWHVDSVLFALREHTRSLKASLQSLSLICCLWWQHESDRHAMKSTNPPWVSVQLVSEVSQKLQGIMGEKVKKLGGGQFFLPFLP